MLIANLIRRVRGLRLQSLRGFNAPRDRARATRDEVSFDCGLLCRLWANFHQVTPGGFRPSRPNFARLENWAAVGSRHGPRPGRPFGFEDRSASAYDASTMQAEFNARKGR
jgi:hypothetical protein